MLNLVALRAAVFFSSPEKKNFRKNAAPGPARVNHSNYIVIGINVISAHVTGKLPTPHIQGGAPPWKRQHRGDDVAVMMLRVVVLMMVI